MPKRKLPPNEEVIEMYNSGMSSGEIAEKCSVAPVTVLSLLARLGIPRRSAREAAKIRDEKGRGNYGTYWLGRKQSPEMIESRVSKIRGENHYLWRGGKSKRDYRKVIAKVKCVQCERVDNLGIHHKNLDHYDNTLENLEVLCVSCHMSLHKQAYWDAIHSGKKPSRSNAPTGWKRK